jgi:hypothetical protein
MPKTGVASSLALPNHRMSRHSTADRMSSVSSWPLPNELLVLLLSRCARRLLDVP